MDNFLYAMKLLAIGAVIGYFWFPVWRVIRKIFENAWKATYGEKHE